MANLTADDIRAAYSGILGREADPAGLDHYLARAAEGLSRQELVRLLTASEEFLGQSPLPGQFDLGPDGISQLTDRLMPHILSRLSDEKPWRHAVFVPSPEVYASPHDAPFMPFSTCSGADFLHPRFSEILASLGLRNELHRKLWEWVFVVHHLIDAGVVRSGNRGLAFGVGQELLPSLFASMGARVTATDAPAEIGIDAGWQSSNEYAQGLAAIPEGKLDRAEFERLVEWRACDMNAIDPALTGYDFCWSSCCFEHLGSLRHGMDFVIEAVENTLRPGGVAVHTTEFNLSSNDATITEGGTVLYRKRDIEDLIAELRGRGHQVEPFRLAPDSLTVDGYVDLPPYRGPHVKLGLEGYVCTSVGLVIRRGQ